MAKQSLTAELFYSGTWHAVAAYTRDPAFINRDRPVGAEPTPSTVTVTLQGIHNPKNPVSPLYGVAGQNTPVRLKLGSAVRFYGEVSAWKPGRAIKGDEWTVIECSGILRRLGQGAAPLRSALYRSMIGAVSGDIAPAEYWPLEDGTESTQFASAVGGLPGIGLVGGAPAGVDPPAPAGHSGIPGSAPTVLLPANAIVRLPIRAYTDTGQWVAQGAFDADTADSGVEMELFVASGREISAAIDAAGTFELFVEDSSGVLYSDFDTFSEDIVGEPLSLVVALTNAAGGTLTGRVLDGNGDVLAELTTTGVGYSMVQQIDLDNFPVDTLGAGHVALFTDASFDADVDTVPGARAMSGHAGEQAHERVERLCLEEGIPITIEGSESQPMGPQPIETLVNLLAECERTDDGILFEPRDDYGLLYRCGRERYNRPVVIGLFYEGDEITPPLVPVLDDLTTRNHVTVQRRNGSSAIAVQETGPLSILAPPDGIGTYKTQVDVNTATDDVLPNHAGWWLHKGTVDGIRYERVTLNPDITGEPGVDIGDVISIQDLPDDETLVTQRMMVTGYTELIESHQRLITYSCIPAQTYDVGVYGTDTIVSRYDSAHSTLAASYDDNDTSFSVATAAGHALWVTGSSSPTFPFDIEVEGIRIPVTAISGGSSPQTFTVQRSADGDDKALSSGSQVRLWDPARYAL